LVAEDELIDHLVQMNMGEIRTRVHVALMAPILNALAADADREQVVRILNTLLSDEVRHIAYTARFIEKWSAGSTATAVAALYSRRLRDFNQVTIDQTETAWRMYGQGIFPRLLEV
jgi:uncharacterized ferritin-like protein (DUF455 family)